MSVGGVGLGMNFTIPGQFSSRVQLAYPTNQGADPSDGNVSRWWFDFTYSF